MPDSSIPSGRPSSWNSLLESLPIGVLLADAQGRYIEANPAASTILGYRKEVLLNSGLPEPRLKLLAADGSLHPCEGTPGVMALRTRQPVHGRVLGLVREDGDTLWLEVSAEPLTDGGVLISFSDITRHHLTETILAARARISEMAATASLEEILRATLDETERLTGSCIGFYHFMEPDQRTLTLQAWSTRTESEFCMAIGKGLHYPVDQAGVWVDAVLARKPVIHNDYAGLPHKKGMPEGHAKVIRELVVPVLRGDLVMALVGVGNKPYPYGNRDVQTVLRLADLAWDIAERKRSEVALRESETRWHTVVEQAGDGVELLDENGRYLQVNEAGCRSLGYSRDELLQRGVVDNDPNLTPEIFRAQFEALIGQPAVTFETRHRRRDGTEFPVEVTASVILLGERHRALTLVRDISERKLAEQALHESESRFRNMFDAAPIGLWEEDFSEVKASFEALRKAGVHDFARYFDEHPEEVARFASQVRIVGINQAGVQTLNAESEQAIFRDLTKFFTPDSLMAFKEELLALAVGRTHYRVEAPHLDARGNLLFFDVSYTVQPGYEGSLARVLVSFVDITARRKMESALRESELLARTALLFNDRLLKTMPIGAVVYRVDTGRCVMANEAMAHAVGGTQEDLLSQCFREIPSWKTAGLLEVAERVLMTDRDEHFEFHIQTTFARECWLSCELSTFSSIQGKNLLVLALDITARKRADLALLRSEQQYRGLFDSMKEGFALHEILTDEQGQPTDYRFLDVNPAFVAMTGLPRDRWVGRTVREVLPGIEPRWILEYGQVALSGGSITFEDESRDLGRWFRVTAYRPGPRRFAVLATDITEHRRAEEERLQLERQVARTQKMESLGSLAGGVAHDMNNVLAAIMGLASIHEELAPEDSQLHKSMSTILKACTRGRTLVKGLLGFARQGLEEVRVLDLNDVIREEVALLERTIPANVRINLDLAPGLHPILGDPASLSHVLMNLCVNAIDAMPEGGTLSLLTRHEAADQICLEVVDTGTGMSPEVMEKALDPFFTTKGLGKGTGLGLAIVYGAVKAHHGQLELTSAPGQGTRVLMRFPATSHELPAGARAPGRSTGGSSLEILVVDDDELIQDSLAELLRSMGHHPTVARSGEEALHMLDQGLSAAVVLLDLNMPGLGGAGTLPKLRACRPDLPVLLATGRADQSAVDLVARTPNTVLLPKPFSAPEIVNHLRNLGLG